MDNQEGVVLQLGDRGRANISSLLKKITSMLQNVSPCGDRGIRIVPL
jgi:hypothetical protein